ncbi:cilia- and flagella-associated protein 47 [Arapaima gigas]
MLSLCVWSVALCLPSVPQTSLQFHGVYCGSRWAAPFTLQNRTAGRAVVRFCLLDHQEFSVETSRGGRPAWPEGDQAPHTYSVEMEGHEAVGCSLIFCPKEVAAHDFVLPTTLNGISAPSPPPSLVPKTLSASSRHIITPRTCSVSVATPCCRVQATVLRPPLDVSPSSVHFELQPSALKLDPQVLQLRNVSQEEVSWRFEITAAGLEDPEEQFGVSPLSGKLDPGQSVCVSVTFSPGPLAPGRLTFSTELLLFLFEEKIQPFRRLRLSAALLLPSVTFRPLRVLLPPVPLDTPARATVCLLPSGFSRGPSLRIQVEKVDLKDGSQLEPFSVLLPHGGAVPASGLVEPFICVVTFCSPSPLACTSLITFLDQENRSFQLQVCAVTDNCLLTLWPHVALCRSDPHDPPKSELLNPPNPSL